MSKHQHQKKELTKELELVKEAELDGIRLPHDAKRLRQQIRNAEKAKDFVNDKLKGE